MLRTCVRVSMLAGILVGVGGCGGSSIRLKVDPPEVSKGQATVSATFPQDAKEGVSITFDVTEGRDCGSVDPPTKKTDGHGFAQTSFKPSGTVATACEATITASDESKNKSQASITVLPTSSEAERIEATSAITIILIASFAIDRIVNFLLFLFGGARKSVSLSSAEKSEILEDEKRKERLFYIGMAAILGLALGYFGKVRILEGLGFSRNVPINVILTALVLTAGSDSISALLKRAGGGSIGESEPKPLEIRGNLVLDRPAEAKRRPAPDAERKPG